MAHKEPKTPSSNYDDDDNWDMDDEDLGLHDKDTKAKPSLHQAAPPNITTKQEI